MNTHQVIGTGWCGEHKTIEFEGTQAQCRAYLAEHGQQADYIRRIPGQAATAARQSARAAMLASFGVQYRPK